MYHQPQDERFDLSPTYYQKKKKKKSINCESARMVMNLLLGLEYDESAMNVLT